MQNVVIVDDSEDSAAALGDLIESFGHRVRTALDGTTGLALLETERTNVLIVDLGLPDIDGCRVAETARERCGSGLHIIAITGQSSESHRERARRAGIDVFIVKPVDPDRLATILNGQEAR